MSSSEKEAPSEQQLKEFQKAFGEFDVDNKGVIIKSNLISVMKKLDQNPSNTYLDKMFKNVDTNGNEVIEFDEFVEMMLVYMQEQDDIVNDLFALFDKNKNGVISRKELRAMMKSIGEKLTEHQLKEMMKFADTNGDGEIDRNEFKRLLSQVFQSSSS